MVTAAGWQHFYIGNIPSLRRPNALAVSQRNKKPRSARLFIAEAGRPI
jgi:hypothetical protein